MNKLDDETVRRIETQIEVGMRYQKIGSTPERMTKMMALVAMRLFMYRFGYDQVLMVIKQQGPDTIANAVQRELNSMADIWTHAMAIEPPPPETVPGVQADIDVARRYSRDAEVNRLLYAILSRLRIREDMIENRKALPTPTVQ